MTTNFTLPANGTIQLYCYGLDSGNNVAPVSNFTFSAEPASLVTLTPNDLGVVVGWVGPGTVKVHGQAVNSGGTTLSAESDGALGSVPVPLAVTLVLGPAPAPAA